MKLLVLFSLFFLLHHVLAHNMKCPGGRIEYRKTGKFCCYDKEETSCYKLISPLRGMLDEDELRLARTRPGSPPPFHKPLDEDRRSRGLPILVGTGISPFRKDEDRTICPPGFTFPLIGGRCCNRPFPPHTCVPARNSQLGVLLLDELLDEKQTKLGAAAAPTAVKDPSVDEINEDENDSYSGRPYRRRHCPWRYPVRIDRNKCCTSRYRPRRCMYIYPDEAADEEV